MPISARLENKVSFHLEIEGEDVFRFKKLIETSAHYFKNSYDAVKDEQPPDIVKDVQETLKLAENILQRFK